MRYIKLPGHFIRMLYQNTYMIRSMVIRDIRARYVGSLLGIFWSLIHPLIQLILYYFIFSVVFKVRLGPEYGGTHFAFWLMAGLLPWLFVAEVVGRSPGSVLEQSNLIKKMAFPSEILPFTILVGGAVNHLIGIVIFVGFVGVFGQSVSLKILWVFPYLMITGGFVLGIGWLLASLNVFLRDIGQIIGVVVNIGFYLTPILYPSHLVPERFQGLYRLNPIFHTVEGYRMALLGKGDVDWAGLGYLGFACLFTCVLGGMMFKKLKPAFADVL